MGLRYGLALAGSLVVSFGLMNFLLDGGLWQHAFANQILPWGWGRFAVSAGKLVGEYWPLLAWCSGVLLFALILVVRTRGHKDALLTLFANPFALITIYFLVATSTTATRIGRNGTNYNHLLDMLLPACVMVGATLYIVCRSLTEKQADGEPRWRSLAAMVAMCALIDRAGVPLYARNQLVQGRVAEPADRFADEAIVFPGVEYAGQYLFRGHLPLLSNGRPVVYDDPFMFVSLANVGKWDDSVLNAHLREHYYLPHPVGAWQWAVYARRQAIVPG